MDIPNKKPRPFMPAVIQAEEQRILKAATRAAQKPAYQAMLRRLKAKVSLGLTIEEAIKEVGASKRQAEILVSMLGSHVVEKRKLYLQHIIRLQTRYSQVELLRRRAKTENDLKTESQMILLATKLDDSLLDLPIRLGLVKDDERYVSPATELGVEPEQLNEEWLRSEIARYDAIIAAQEETCPPLITLDALGDGTESIPQRGDDELQGVPVADANSEGHKSENSN